MAEFLKTTFLGFFREGEGSTPVLQPRTQTNMADPLIAELEVRRALDGKVGDRSRGRPERSLFNSYYTGV